MCLAGVFFVVFFGGCFGWLGFFLFFGWLGFLDIFVLFFKSVIDLNQK